MFDLRMLRENLETYIERLNTRGSDFSYLRDIVEYDNDRRRLITEVEELKQKRNDNSKKIGQLIRDGISDNEVNALKEEVNQEADKINQLDSKIKVLDKKIFDLMAITPNVPCETTPIGKDENDNIVVKQHGQIPNFDFEPKAHYDIAEELGMINFELAGKLAGSRFAVYTGMGAKLERALINFMLDTQTLEHGFTEFIPPFMANTKTMYNTGQLPKFEEDMFGVEDTDYWLIPTAEVPLTNIAANEILQDPELPMKLTAYTPCFRREAGSAGRDTRGLIRQHQFNKVEMVMYAHPDKSYEALDLLTGYAENILQKLGLPYQVLALCTGDMGAAAAKTNDLEVWMPSADKYREISSCSNCEDYQARRGNIKFKEGKGKPTYLHTLNGSGLAVGRAFAAILENYQTKDGDLIIPDVLVPYMNGVKIIKKQK